MNIQQLLDAAEPASRYVPVAKAKLITGLANGTSGSQNNLTIIKMLIVDIGQSPALPFVLTLNRVNQRNLLS